MKGYWNRKAETASAFTDDGYFITGDIAMIDEKGYYRIVDRVKDMIIVSGFNVYPNEIEDIIAEHPDITECAVIGVPDPKAGEVVKAFIISHDSGLKSEDVQQWCKARLTGYKVPKQVEFVEDLPKSNVGKVLRRLLKTPDQDVA